MAWTEYPMMNTSSTMDFITYSNVVTNNMFFPLTLVVFFIIMFVSMIKANIPIDSSFVSSSFVVTLLSYLMYPMGLIGEHIIYTTTILTLIAFLVLFITKK